MSCSAAEAVAWKGFGSSLVSVACLNAEFHRDSNGLWLWKSRGGKVRARLKPGAYSVSKQADVATEGGYKSARRQNATQASRRILKMIKTVLQ